MFDPYGMPQPANPMQFAQQLMGNYQQRMNPPQELIRVTGIEGAKAYQMAPNSCVPLFDADNDVMYIKSTDGAGFPTIRTFTFAPAEATATPSTEYVTRMEFTEFEQRVKEMIGDGQQFISKSQGPDAGGRHRE